MDDQQLCEISNLAVESAEIDLGSFGISDHGNVLETIRAEASTRGLRCVSLRWAESYCRSVLSNDVHTRSLFNRWPRAPSASPAASEPGPVFRRDAPSIVRCVSVVEPIERAGSNGLKELDDQELCELASLVERYGKIDRRTKHAIGYQVSVDSEVVQRNANCMACGIWLKTANPDHQWIFSGLVLVEGRFYEPGASEPFTGHRELRKADGQLLRKSDSLNGLIHGPQTWYDSRGIRQSYSYERGQLNGIHRVYYDSGLVKIQSYYRDGKLHGLLTRWNRDGEITTQKCYEKGKVTNRSPKKCLN